MRLLWLCVAVGAWLAAGSTTFAAFIYDLRFANGSKSTVVAPNTSYTLQLWGQITGDANKTNDFWQSGYVSVDAVKVGAGGFSNPANLATVGITSAVLGTNVNVGANAGAQRSLQPDNVTPFLDNIRGWGGTANGQASSGWLLWRGGNNPGFAGGVFNSQSVDLGANGQEVLLATFTVQTGATINELGNGTDATQFVLRTQNTVSNGLGQVQTLLYGNDQLSSAPLLTMTTGNVSGRTTSVSFLAPNVIPEPSTFALGGVLLVGLAGLKLRRKNA
jgi:hypothetical protein